MSCLPTYKGKRYNSIKELKAEHNKYNGEPSLYNAKNKTAYLIKEKKAFINMVNKLAYTGTGIGLYNQSTKNE